MEVHPPEHPIHTWRDFFVHIATIVVGLLIAIALEQSVEALHRRHLLHQAETKLHSELLDNEQTLRKDRQQIVGLRGEIEANIVLLQAMEAHAPNAGDQHMNWQWSGMQEAAWNTARDSGALTLMPYELAQDHDEVYRQARLVNDQATLVFRDIFASAALVQGGRKLSDLKPAELEQTITASRQVLVDLNYLDMLAENLDAIYRGSEGRL